MPPQLFALCIGIDECAHPEIENLQGCEKDVMSLRDALLLGYPDAQILSLTNQAATRKGILDSLKRHLIANDHILVDDPILIYFAGYGQRFEGKERDVDALIPYDYAQDVPPIFDVTLHGLLNMLVQAKGPNVTVILDCCFSPALILSAANIRRIQTPSWPSHLADLRRENSLVGYRGFFDNQSYVLIAASNRNKHCAETPSGAFFTQSMVSAMRSSWLLSCRELTVRTQNWEIGTAGQVSACYGPYLDRLLFMPPKLLPITKLRVFSSNVDLGVDSVEDPLFHASRRWNANVVVRTSSQTEANMQRLDRLTARYGTLSIPFALAKTPQVLNGVARFNYYLNLRPSCKRSWVQRFRALRQWRKSDSPSSIEIYHFKPDEEGDGEDDAWISENILHNGVALLDDVPNDHLLGLKITNTSDQSMYPYVFHFDTDTYEITELYSPLREDEGMEPKVLKPHESLIFGRSRASNAPTFCVPESPFRIILDEDKVERTAQIFKIILAQKPVVLRYMEQASPMTSGEERTRGPTLTRRFQAYGKRTQ